MREEATDQCRTRRSEKPLSQRTPTPIRGASLTVPQTRGETQSRPETDDRASRPLTVMQRDEFLVEDEAVIAMCEVERRRPRAKKGRRARKQNDGWEVGPIR